MDNPNIEQVSFSIREFCARNGISLTKFHGLKRGGRSPAEMRLGPIMVRISADAERAWQRTMENPTGAEAERQSQMKQQAILRGQQAGALSVLSASHPANVKRAKRNLADRAREFAAARGRQIKTA
jgi:hypothetical protein